MKNKKLFAILTLVCFMFTLMPVAAFAADQVLVGGEEEITVTAGDNNIKATVGETAEGYVFYAVEGEEVVAVSVDGTFTIKAEGEYQIYAVKAEKDSAIYKYFEAVGDPADKVTMIEENYSNAIVDEYATVEVEAVEDKYDFEFVKKTETANGKFTGAQSASIKANNGYDYVEVTVKLTNNGEKVKNEEITVSHSSYLTVTADAEDTGKKGQITYRIAAKRGGDEYPITFKYDGHKETFKVSAWTEGIKNVEVVAEPKAARNIDTAHQSTGVELKFYDADGVAVTTGVACQFTVVSQPAKGDAEGKDFSVWYDSADKVWKLVSSEKLDEGTYKVKVSLENGKSATASFSVAKMDDVARIIFDKAPTSITFGGEQYITDNKVIALDANGVAQALKVTDENLSLTVNGKAVATAEYKDDKFVIKTKTEDAEKYVGTTVTVMAAYEVDDETFLATLELEVVDSAAGFVYEDAKAEVGVTADLTATPVDANGKETDLNADASDAKVIVLEKPEGAYVNADAAWDEANNEVDVEFLATAVGEYKIQTIVATGNIYVSSINTITVGANEASFKDVVVMSIGANKIVVNNEVVTIDAAPIIENNRTFVPFRALAEAFGAEVAYDEATQVVTATLGDVTVEMTINSAEYTVNGEVKTADVAPFIKDSRTMVPVRFVAEAFGINVTPVYGDNGATVDVLFAK